MISKIDYLMQLEQEIDKQRNNVKKEKDKCKNAIKFIKDELILIEQETLYDTIIYQEKINKLLKILGDNSILQVQDKDVKAVGELIVEGLKEGLNMNENGDKENE